MELPAPVQHEAATVAELEAIIHGGRAILAALQQVAEAQYLADAALQARVENDFCAVCAAVGRLESAAPGVAADLSYRDKIRRFHGFLTGDPALLRHDFVYAVAWAKLPLLVLEATELRKVISDL